MPDSCYPRIRHLQLTDFRNYAALRLDCDPSHIVLTGGNGSGKTNLLEAISFLAPGRGLRRAGLEDPARKDGPGTWSVHARLDDRGDIRSIGTGLVAGGASGEGRRSREIRVDGERLRGSEALLDLVRVVWLTPAMDGLFTGPASDRRRFLDRMVLSIDKLHGRRVAEYEQAMRSRNRLLSDRHPDLQWLDAIESQLCERAVAIHLARGELIGLLRGLAVRLSKVGGEFPTAEIELADKPPLDGFLGPATDLEERLRTSLEHGRRQDAAAGRTLVGPHRSDLVVTNMDKAMPAATCSTGEQKALLLGLVLAHAELVRETTGMAPVLLLDEIAAHLDEKRRSAMFDRIDRLGGQAWMTGTDRSLFDAMDDRAQRFTVDNGTLRPD